MLSEDATAGVPLNFGGFVRGSQNWRGKPLLTHATIVNLIAGTRTTTGLKVRCELDRHDYPKQVKVTDDQMRTIHLEPDSFHGDWNYTIRPSLK